MAEQYGAAAHGDHVVVKHAGVDRVRVLLCEQRARGCKRMAASDGFRRFARLAGRKAARSRRFHVEGYAAVDEQLDTDSVVGRGEPRVIGRPLVAELLRRRQRVVHHEALFVVEDRAQQTRRGRSLERAVEMRYQVGGGEMNAAVGGIGGGTDRGGVGNPHRRCRRARGKQLRCLPRGRGENLFLAAGKAERAERRNVGPLVRRQHALRESAIGERFHLGEPLEGCLARIGDKVLVALGSEVADGQAAVVMRRARQPVEVDFERLGRHFRGGRGVRRARRAPYRHHRRRAPRRRAAGAGTARCARAPAQGPRESVRSCG